MTRAILLAAIVATLAPLGAQSLMERFFEGKKPSKVAKDWFKGLDDWVNDLHDAARDPVTWFPDADGKLRRYRLEAASPTTLTARELLDTGGKNNKDEPERIPAKETVVFSWRQWPKPVMASTYPTTSNESTADVIAFATWLYEEKAPREANRVLTILYKKIEGEDPDLQEAICEFVREQEGIKGSPDLKLFELWDDQFKVFRTILIPSDQADKLRALREKAAKARFMELKSEYGDPATGTLEARTLTLEQLKFELERWAKDFADTGAVSEFADIHKKLIRDVGNDIKKAKVFQDLAAAGENVAPAKPADWSPIADDWENALKLDPCSLLLLSKAANARYAQTAPELFKKKWVGEYHVAQQAIDLYILWLQRTPANVKVIFNLGVLHHVRAERTEAIKRYNEVIALDLDAQLTRKAREYKDIE